MTKEPDWIEIEERAACLTHRVTGCEVCRAWEEGYAHGMENARAPYETTLRTKLREVGLLPSIDNG